jgi:hypothetical protein
VRENDRVIQKLRKEKFYLRVALSSTSHWCLAHYLIDGHHKVYAAAQENKPLTLISFLAVDQGVSSEEEIDELVSVL